MAWFAPAQAEETCDVSPSVRVILNDGHRLVIGGLARVCQALETELSRLGIKWTTSLAIQVSILPHDASDGDLGSQTLGAVKRDSGEQAFIFYPAVARMLGSTIDPRITSYRPAGALWAKGLARIIIHEILHVLLPGRPHDAAGLFAQRQTRRDLFARKLELSPETRAELVARVTSPPPCDTVRETMAAAIDEPHAQPGIVSPLWRNSRRSC